MAERTCLRLLSQRLLLVLRSRLVGADLRRLPRLRATRARDRPLLLPRDRTRGDGRRPAPRRRRRARSRPALYASGVVLNPHIQSERGAATVGTITRAVTYVTIGGLIGWFAGRNRSMLAELRVLAERDVAHRPPQHAGVRVGDHAPARRRPAVRARARGHGRAQGLQPRGGPHRRQRRSPAAGGTALQVARSRRRRGAGRQRRVRRPLLPSELGRRGAACDPARADARDGPDDGDGRLGRVPAGRRQRARALPGGERAALRAQGDAELPAAGPRASRGRSARQATARRRPAR